MHVGILRISLHVPEANSLKEKRQVVKSILDRSRARFQVAAAEVEEQDLHRRATLGFSSVSNSYRHAESKVRAVLDALRVHPAARIIEYDLDVL